MGLAGVRSLGSLSVIAVALLLASIRSEASSIDYPPNGCIPDTLPEGSAHAAASMVATACDTTGVKFTNISDPDVAADIQLIYSQDFLPSVHGYPYMTSDRINLYLRSLDLDQGTNEFNINWRDFQLDYNYFLGT